MMNNIIISRLGFLIDVNNNKIDLTKFTKKEAYIMLESLDNCKDCLNCSDLKGCLNCVDCHVSLNLNNCTGLNNKNSYINNLSY